MFCHNGRRHRLAPDLSEEVETIPQFGEDIFRAVTRLPGITGDDFSAKFTVRGGENDQVLVRVDGVELYDPFHLMDIGGGALSIIDVGLIEGVDLLTGGYPAEYGDKLSGVFDVRTRTPQPGRTHAAVGLSMMNARALIEGGSERSSWLVSARRACRCGCARSAAPRRGARRATRPAGARAARRAAGSGG